MVYIRTPGEGKPLPAPTHASTRVHAWKRCIVGRGACLESCTARGRAMVGIAKDSWSANRFQDTQKDPARKRAGPSLFPLPTEQQDPARKRAGSSLPSLPAEQQDRARKRARPPLPRGSGCLIPPTAGAFGILDSSSYSTSRTTGKFSSSRTLQELREKQNMAEIVAEQNINACKPDRRARE